MPALRIIRQSDFTPKPWKNGAGVTHEAIRVPADGADFTWRVSVARIETSGPFSDFAGYRRKMVLLEGEGVRLNFADGSEQRLLRAGDLAEFNGAPAPDCRLIGGPCLDLNLMVATAHPVQARVQWLGARERDIATAAPGQTTLIFSLSEALVLSQDGAAQDILQPGDLCTVSNGSVAVRLQAPGADGNPGAVFFATIGDQPAGVLNVSEP